MSTFRADYYDEDGDCMDVSDDFANKQVCIQEAREKVGEGEADHAVIVEMTEVADVTYETVVKVSNRK